MLYIIFMTNKLTTKIINLHTKLNVKYMYILIVWMYTYIMQTYMKYLLIIGIFSFQDV